MVDDQGRAEPLNCRHRLMPEPVAPQETPPIDPLAPQPFPQMSPESDADHLLKQMISRRRKPPAASDAGIVPPASAVEAPAPIKVEEPKAEEPKPTPAGFNDAIAGVLKFKPAPKKKEEPKAEEPAATQVQEPQQPEAPPKTIVAKKRVAVTPAPPDITQITTAATTAAVRALQSSHSKPADAVLKPEDALKPEDRHEYEVAKSMAETNPKFKDAPRLILDHVKKSESYADRWLVQNPGRQFDPDDEEHNDFYDGLQKPWSDHEFRTAEIEMAAERVAAKRTSAQENRLRELEKDNARVELGGIVQRTFEAAAGHMATELKVVDRLKAAGDFDKFRDEDPITADAMASALGPIQPLIEAIVQIDDPKGRFPIDERNPAHQAWIQLLTEKEAQYAGVESQDGKMFATRIAFREMNPAQRARHWYLTPDHLVSEVVQEAVATASERLKTEKEKQKKIALSLGYVLAPEQAAAAARAAATNGAAGTGHVQPQPGATKPVSPSVGSGAKIDTKGTSTPTGRAATLAAMGDILFRPGNAVP